MADFTPIALAVKPVDVATPLMQAAKIRQAQMEEQTQRDAQVKQAAGDWARGVAVYAGKPEFAQKWAEGLDDLHNRGMMPTQAYQSIRNTPSPLMLQQIIAQTTDPRLAFQMEESKRAQSNADRQFSETQRMNTAQISNMEQQRTLQERQITNAENAPIPLPYGTGLANKKGEILREPTNTGLLDKDTIGMMADQYIAGDTSVLTNLGRGAQGAENIVALRKAIAEKNTAAGSGGAEQAARNAEYFGTKAGQRTLGTKQANIEMAATEFKQVVPVVQEASKAVNRTNYPDLNRIIQAYEQKTGDPNIVKFGGGVNTLVNLYARAISPSGAPTVSDKDHAREILSKSWAQGQFEAAVGMMQQEIDAALTSPEKVREDMRRRFLGGQPGGAQHKTDTTPAPKATGNVPPPPPGFVMQ